MTVPLRALTCKSRWVGASPSMAERLIACGVTEMVGAAAAESSTLATKKPNANAGNIWRGTRRLRHMGTQDNTP